MERKNSGMRKKMARAGREKEKTARKAFFRRRRAWVRFSARRAE